MLKFILWTALALLMLVCCIIDIATGSWFALGICIVALVFDTIDAILAFKEWRRRGKK